MKIPNKAYLDGDIIAYRSAFWAEANNPDYLINKIQETVFHWTPLDSSVIIALSCPRKENFRREIWPAYKSNRIEAYRPEYLDEAKDILQDLYKHKILPHLEADDVMGIYASSGKGIAVTIDKDLKGVRGWHYNPVKDDEPVYISKKQAHRFFCQQWMSGDSTDGIPGLWRIGPKKADKFLSQWDKKDWIKEILALYETEKYCPKNTCDLAHPHLAIAMARCVKILEKSNFNLRTKEIKHWIPKVG